MLRKELSDEPFNKAQRNRALQDELPNRGRGSIEFKHQNISAILIELGYPYVRGYKPRRNYQDLLRDVVVAHLARDSALALLVQDAVEAAVTAPSVPADVLTILTRPPVSCDKPTRVNDRPGSRPPTATRTNYLEREARNRSLGRAGEELILKFEHERLWQAGRRALADRIEHVSVSRGDGLGYDIESFEESGKPRLIEVKTTRFGSMTPFFASRNEVAVSANRQQEYFLYRVYDFRTEPRLFMLPGALAETCDLEPVEFRATAR